MRELRADLQLQLVPRPAEVPATRFAPSPSPMGVSIAGRASATLGRMPVSVLFVSFHYYILFLLLFGSVDVLLIAS